MIPLKCAVPNCHRTAAYLQKFQHYNIEMTGLVCTSHDNYFGVKNLEATGYTHKQARFVEKELKEQYIKETLRINTK